MNEQAPVSSGKMKKNNRTTWLLVCIMVVGALIMAYPIVSNWWNSYHSTQAIVSYAKQVESTDTAELSAMLDAAHAYNAKLPEKENLYTMSEEDLADYNSLLNLSGDGLMGYIRIPGIKVNIPIYHGTEESILQTAIGHINWTALPVGGEGTHAVLSGHRGLPSARLFSDLDKVKEGDLFTVTVLNQTVTYEVDQIRIVEPKDIRELIPVPGKDYCTLVTCTPYGINTHRLLVRGHRVENEAEVLFLPSDANILPGYITIPAVGIPLLFLFLVVTLVVTRLKRPKIHEDDLEAIRERIEKRD